MSPVLEVHDLHKAFGGIKAVNGVSFSVKEGEILGIIGPNGCGKSTLFNCILGQLEPTQGAVTVSYTHLDVYKRQCWSWPATPPTAPGAMSASRPMRRSRPCRNSASATARNTACLLYTSRCV